MTPYNQYTGSKPPPKWLGYTLFWLFMFPIMLGYAVRLAVTRPLRNPE